MFRPPPAPWRRLLGRPALPETTALRDVSFDLRPGEILGLVGPNGAGKTVLLKLLATLSEPTSGQVRLFGRDSVKDSRSIRFQVGMATCDERSFYWRLTAVQNLTFFAKLCGFDRQAARRRVWELLELLDLEPIADKSYRVLSTGNRQRLAIARALLLDPKVLLLDEPTNSLDPIAAARLRAVVRDRIHADADRAILITSHNLEEVQDLSARVAILRQGRILEVDTLPSLCRRYGECDRVTIEVREGVGEQVLAGLRKCVAGVRLDAEGRLRFEQEPGGDALEVVVRELVSRGLGVSKCSTEGASLKNLFDRLIDTSAAPHSAPEAMHA